MMTANEWIQQLELVAHPESGYFKETIRDDSQGRAAFSSIYFLLTHHDISHFHRINADEVWYYHAGQTLTIHTITTKGKYHTVKLGRDIKRGDFLQYCVPKGTIFASSSDGTEGYSLVGCMCQPGFEYEHFELLTQEYLNHQYPQFKRVIKRLAISQVD